MAQRMQINHKPRGRRLHPGGPLNSAYHREQARQSQLRAERLGVRIAEAEGRDREAAYTAAVQDGLC